MGSGATKREILEKKLEKRLQDPATEPVISLPLDFLEDITCGFSTERELGRGACGVVYKGVLQSGKAIAVKKIFDTHLLGNDNQVVKEIICLTEVRHPNVVQLVGYCVETKWEVVEHSGKHVMAEKHACLLCFEFLCNGSLDKHLSDDTSGLDWDERYKIIRGVCRGLHYLHDKRRIAHRDLKPQNIVMDDTMMPKIADFDLSRLLSQEKSRTVTAKLQGTPGYMAPECIEQRAISFEADIFSLGVIIVEIITGHRQYPNISEATETSLRHYTDEVVGIWRNRLMEITPMHMSPEMHIHQVQQCISIALKCLEPESNKRPSSLDIVQSLNAVEPKCMSPGNPPSIVEKDMRNENLHSQVNMNIFNIPKTISAVNGLNECANLFHWVTSAISSLNSLSNETQKERLQRDICQLHSDLQCLTDTLPAIDNLIDRAEWRIHHDSVADHLSRLKDAVYDAEDLLDEFRWFEKKVSVEGNAISVEPVIKFFQSVTQGSFNKVTGIQKRLSNLSKQLERPGLLPAIPKFDKSSRPETSFFSIEEKMIGRDEENKNLIKLLLDKPSNESSTINQVCATTDSDETTIASVRVLPIVGIGGVGKTTLAQDICKNSKVKGHFDMIIWICVSDDFDVKRLTKEAIEQTSGEVLQNGNLNSLQLALSNSVKKKRFLIVLDDMWDENEKHWKHFCAPFKKALEGSMMLVTTRSLKVADVVRTTDPITLEGLKEDVFRKFFKFCVFGPNNFNIDPELQRIGEKILPKLRGSPLAAKTLGRLLGMSLEPAHWDRILKSQLWELQQKETDILPALRLSYIYLPLYLKRCFSFCAVYPKDYIFKKEDLVEIWMAEGLVEHHPNISLQHTGGEYFEELAHLSFFQKYARSHNEYVIHDLMHDMAQLVSKDECFIVKERNDLPKIPQNVRHLSVLKDGDVQFSDLLKHDMAQHRKLRTLFCHLSLTSESDNALMEKWCNQLLCMRVMVCNISNRGLPGSISNLKLLRYLQILNSSFSRSLPSAFCCLYNMQIFYAKKWKICGIPRGFAMLINMQKFESKGCQFPPVYSIGSLKGATDQGQKSQFVLKNYNGESLPRWFHPQNSVQIVTDVVFAYCSNLSNLEEFLQSAYVPIIKNIEISNCRSLESVPTERFGDLRFLEVLSVSRCPKIKSRHLFAPSLKKLYLEDSGNLGYKIECSSLIILHLRNCRLESIELHMWNLPLLQELEISFCLSRTVIRDSEPISSDIFHGQARSRTIDSTLSSLIDVKIQYCDNLSSLEEFLQPAYVAFIKKIEVSCCPCLESVPTDRFGDFHFLEVLSVSHCPKIKSQHLLAPSLKKLYLEDSGDLGYKIECNSLIILHLSNCPLESIELQMWNLPLLKNLLITRCSSLTIIRDSKPISTDLFHGGAQSRMGKFPLLAVLTIEFCKKLTNIDDLLHLPAVERISIMDCGLLSLAAHRLASFSRLKDFQISRCQSLNWQSGMLPRSLQNLMLSSCGDFSAWLPSCLENLTSLQSLDIGNCECIVSLPGHLWSSNLRSLQSLTLLSCSKLKSIGGPRAIARIKNLHIVNCPELKEIVQPMRRSLFL